jgi:hypothetical protein
MDKNRTTDAEIEGLFAGSPSPGDLNPLADLFTALRTGPAGELDDQSVTRIVAVAASVSLGVAATPPTAAPTGSQTRGQSLLHGLRRRVAAVAMAATVFVGGTTGLALAADGAKPGDALYGIDRALESVGIGAGAEQERLNEATALIDAGEFVNGLQHAAETLDERTGGDANSVAALREAAERVRAADSDRSAATRERVAGLLTYLSENVGNVDGREVAELAQQIGGPAGQPNAATPPGQIDRPDPPAQGPSDPPGRSNDKPGPPDHVPTEPPGRDKADPGPPDSKPNPPKSKP